MSRTRITASTGHQEPSYQPRPIFRTIKFPWRSRSNPRCAEITENQIMGAQILNWIVVDANIRPLSLRPLANTPVLQPGPATVC